MNALEIISTLLGVWSCIEIIRRKARGLVIGFAAFLLLACLFHQHRLYSDMGLMLYYAAGLLVWTRRLRK